VNPVLGGILVELEQHVGVVDDLGDRLRVFGAVVDLERFDRDLSLVGAGTSPSATPPAL
jgi:hypothetical protein